MMSFPRTRESRRNCRLFLYIPFSNALFLQSGREDLNLRLHGPEPCALPDCATPRKITACPGGIGKSSPPLARRLYYNRKVTQIVNIYSARPYPAFPVGDQVLRTRRAPDPQPMNRDFSAGLNIFSAGVRVCRFPLWNREARSPP